MDRNIDQDSPVELRASAMTTVVVDKELRNKLKDLEHPVEFCDEAGKTVGRFLPEAEYKKILYDLAGHMFTDDELDAAEKETGGRPLAEILAQLEGR
jgi:hypothetical protein